MLKQPGAPARVGARFFREPLVQFLLLGLVIFGSYRLLHPESGSGRYQIRLTEDDLAQMQVAVLAQERPAPTPEQMKSLIEERVKQEVLYREAVAMGLDQGDEIVKRRMVQKMEFLAEDLSDMKEPTEADLRAYFDQHHDEFLTAGRITFRHLYFSPDDRGSQALGGAAAAAKRLAGKPPEWRGAARLGDPFMFQDRYADRSPQQVAAVFGGGFARAVFSLSPGIWSGPVESGLGWHLVAVEELRPPEVPSFESVEPDVKMAWIAARRTEYQKESYAAMRAKYTVELPNGVNLDSVSAGTGTSPRRIGL